MTKGRSATVASLPLPVTETATVTGGHWSAAGRCRAVCSVGVPAWVPCSVSRGGGATTMDALFLVRCLTFI